MMDRLDELTTLLREAITIAKEDRKLAKDNYNALREQLDDILERGVESSEEGKIESECNKALKLVFESGARMESVINAITKILITQLTNESREKVAASFVGGNFNGKQIITQPIDLKKMIEADDD